MTISAFIAYVLYFVIMLTGCITLCYGMSRLIYRIEHPRKRTRVGGITRARQGRSH